MFEFDIDFELNFDFIIKETRLSDLNFEAYQSSEVDYGLNNLNIEKLRIVYPFYE